MKFSVNANEMKTVMSVVTKAISSKPVMPILSNVKLTIEDDRLILTGGDNETSLSVACGVSDVENFTPICIDAALLNNALGALGGQQLTFQSSGNNLTAVYNGGHFNMPFLKTDEYPSLPMSEPNGKVLISSSSLAEAMRCCRPFAANDELRPTMNGVYFDFTGEALTCVATDGHRLIRKRVADAKREGDTPIAAIVSSNTAGLLAYLPKDADVTVEINETQTRYSCKGYTLVARSIDGRYPNYNSVIPPNNPKHADIDRTDTANALKRVSIMGSKTTGLVRLQFDADMMGGRLTIASEDMDFQTSASESLSATHDIDGALAIGFKGDLLSQILSIMPAGTVRMELSDATRATLIYSADDEQKETLCLLMPMMLNN